LTLPFGIIASRKDALLSSQIAQLTESRLMSAHIAYHILHTPDEIAPITPLEMLVWNMGGDDAVPAHIAQVIVKCGGNIIGAYDTRYPDEGVHGRLVGFTLALVARDFVQGEGWWIWSHMAGVHPDYQRQGMGFALKQAQRDWALAEGFTRMGWTFDPLRAPNAHFNLRMLGATTATYKVNHYGIMTDGINNGFPSDRFIVEWDMNAPRVVAHAQGNIAPYNDVVAEDAPVLLMNERGTPRVNLPASLSAPAYIVHAPEIALIKRDRERALQWQRAFAQVFGATLNTGRYRLVDFIRPAQEDMPAHYLMVDGSQNTLE
jgi:predicted GNAT superfamily acetyltransferase